MAGTITHEWDGTKLIITSDSGTSSCDLKGAQGDMGIRGPQGVKGDTGDIYFLYPVGSIYMSTVSTNPGSFIGGTWTQIKDKFLLAAGDKYTAGATGGSADAVVVAHQHYVDVRGGIGSTGITSGYDAILQTGLGKNNSLYTQTSGQDGTGKNMPPYQAVYMWQRIA